MVMASWASSWINSNEILYARPCLQNRPDVIADQVSIVRKRKWATQIEYTMLELHKIGVVWGDVKPGNVVIDIDDNAWLVDFGGGFTQPWMDPELAGTREGDIQ